jgi:hypothetical protein
LGILETFWDGEELQVGICEYGVDKAFAFYYDFCLFPDLGWAQSVSWILVSFFVVLS